MLGSMRVLLAEDHQELAAIIALGLRREGFAVDIAADGNDALERATINGYDVMVLDRDLPGMHGDDVCKSLVAKGADVRVLMLTAAAAIDDRVAGLGLGADDYLSKPFAFAELVARIRALARRPGSALPPVLVVGDLRLDPANHSVTRAGRALWLTPKEFAVLELLMSARGGPVSSETLLERAWDEMADPFTQTVKVTVSRLRRKLGDPALIETEPRTGYRIVATDPRE
jgi:DNA-binding response OmpR family regulator